MMIISYRRFPTKYPIHKEPTLLLQCTLLSCTTPSSTLILKSIWIRVCLFSAAVCGYLKNSLKQFPSILKYWVMWGQSTWNSKPIFNPLNVSLHSLISSSPEEKNVYTMNIPPPHSADVSSFQWSGCDSSNTQETHQWFTCMFFSGSLIHVCP